MLREETAPARTLPQTGIQLGLAQRVQILDHAAVDEIIAASFRILGQVGVRIDHQPALDLLRANGAQIDDNLVRFPSGLVQRSLDSAPSRVTLHARDPKHNIYLGEGRVHFTSGFGATFVEDIDTGQVRTATLQDLATHVRLADALDRVDYCLFSVVPQDIPGPLLDVECTAVALENTSKHIQLSLETADWVEEVIEIACATVEPGAPPPVSAGGVPNSPLHYTADVAAKFIALARHQVPCFIVVGAMAGATAPVTLAGTLAMQNAEVLAGVVLTQVANPGAPAIYGTFTGAFDMHVTKLSLGGPEATMITAATQQLSERMGIPLGYGTAGVADSMSGDLEAGIEKAGSLMFASLAGVDVIHNAVGLFGSGMKTSLSQMVIDNEICNSIAYVLQGVPVNAESLAEEVIAAVGPGGQFLDTEHTAVNFRQALYLPPFRLRQEHDVSSADRGEALADRAAQRARELLETHRPLPLSAEERRRIDEIRERARLRVAGAAKGI